MARIVACEMAVLDKSLLFMAASDKGNLLVKTHPNSNAVKILLQLEMRGYSRQHTIALAWLQPT